MLTREEQLALLRRFEPILYFSPDERFYPMDVQSFIRQSKLTEVPSSVPFLHTLLGRQIGASGEDANVKMTKLVRKTGQAGYERFLEYVNPADIPHRWNTRPLALIEAGLWLLLLGIIVERWLEIPTGALLAELVLANIGFEIGIWMYLLPLIMTTALIVLGLGCVVGPLVGWLRTLRKGDPQHGHDHEELANILFKPPDGKPNARRGMFEFQLNMALLMCAAAASVTFRPQTLAPGPAWLTDLPPVMVTIVATIYLVILNASFNPDRTVKFLERKKSGQGSWWLGWQTVIHSNLKALYLLSALVVAVFVGYVTGPGLSEPGPLAGLTALAIALLVLVVLSTLVKIRDFETFATVGSIFLVLVLLRLRPYVFQPGANILDFLVRGIGMLNGVLLAYMITDFIRRRVISPLGFIALVSGLHDRTGDRAYTLYQQMGELADESIVPYYGRVFEQEGTSLLVLQYWFFYAFNDWRTRFNGMDDHEGDWEHVDVFVKPVQRPEEEPDYEPVYVLYSQHILPGAFLRRAWNDPDVIKEEETHPSVFVAAGSHANYYRQGRHEITEMLRFNKQLGRIYQAVMAAADAYTPGDVCQYILLPPADAGERRQAWEAAVVAYVQTYTPLPIVVYTLDEIRQGGIPPGTIVTVVSTPDNGSELLGIYKTITRDLPNAQVDYLPVTSDYELQWELGQRVAQNLRFGTPRRQMTDTRDMVDYAAISFLERAADERYKDHQPVRIGPGGYGDEYLVLRWEPRLMDEVAWAQFAGRWGRYVGYSAEAGPPGPPFQGSYKDPIDYAGLLPGKSSNQ